RGRHTELVSVYIPADYDLNKIINHISQEQGTAANIKSKATRESVISSLERMIRHLRLFKRTPPNGLAVFSGNASDKEGKSDIKVWSLEPPEPLKTRIYRCDQTFQLDILKEMMEYKETYGLIVVDRREGNVGLLKGTMIKELVNLTSNVPGKTRAGGQCLMPDTIVSLSDGQFVSIEEIEVKDEVLSYDFAEKKFIPSKVLKKWVVEKDEVYKILIEEENIEASGDHVFFLVDETSKPAKDLAVGDLLLTEHGGKKVRKIKVLQKPNMMIDISVEKENFLANSIVVHNSAQRFARLREGAAKEFFNRIGEAANKEFLEMKNLKGILIGGPGPTKEEFLDGNYLNTQLKRKVIGVQDLGYTGEFGLNELVDKSRDLLAKEAIMEEKDLMQKFFDALAKTPNKVAYGFEAVKKALDMGAVEKLLLSDELSEEKIDELEKKAETMGTEICFISTDTREGIQLKEMGGIAAILRFSLSY
ncbi:hypothetical protein HY643_04485, partial [Candidatus Woesearchaeota archaeon]|nr:hypothetical protein [Candidatus Woesearchaeota archaeon]